METLEYLVEQYQNRQKSKSEIITQLEVWLEDGTINESDLMETLHNMVNKHQLSPTLFDELFNLLQSLSDNTIITGNNALTDPWITGVDTTGLQEPYQPSANQEAANNNDSTVVLNTEKTIVQQTTNTQIAQDEKTILDNDPIAEKTSLNIAGDNKTALNSASPQDRTLASTDNSSQGTPRQIKTGSTIKDRFILKEVIGAGGMSIVFKALDLRKQEAKNKNPYVAIKVLGDVFKNRLQSLLVLERESQQIQKLAHPNIVTVYDFDRDGETIYMTMECLEGKSLDQIISKHKQGMPYEEAVKFVEGMCRGLAYAHSKHIIHSDFKPENVFFTKDKVVKILDFGIARAKQLPGTTQSQDEFDAGSLGALTPPYASCEMFENLEPDPRDDIYALGCVTYKLLTGEHPFDGMPANKARDKKLRPKRLNQLTKRQWRTLEAALSFERENRIPTVVDFLNGFLPRKRSPWFYTAAAAMLISIGVGGYSWFFVSTQPEMHITLTDAQKKTIIDALETAEVYMSMGYLASPPGDSALDQYDKILKIDPTNKQASDGKKAIAEKYLELAEAEMKSQNFEQGLMLIKTGLIVEPDNNKLKNLETKLNELRTNN